MVRVVGCLSLNDDDYLLDKSSPPKRVRHGDETDERELAQSSRVPLGALGFRLSNLADDFSESKLQALLARKLQVKGVMNGQGDTARIYVLSIESLGQECH